MKALWLFGVLAVCLICSFWFLGTASIVSGALSGFCVSATSLFLLSSAIKRSGAREGSVSWGYFLKSFIVRVVVAGALLFLFIGVLKINTIGILAGLVAGLVINTVFLTNLNAKL